MSAISLAKRDNLRSFSDVVCPVKNTYDNVRRLRVHPRVRTDISAVMIAGSEIYPVRIRNISQGGAGIQTADHHEIGHKVTLHLLDGRVFRATVRWSRFGFCGVEFDMLLDSGDVVLGWPFEPRLPSTAPNTVHGGSAEPTGKERGLIKSSWLPRNGRPPIAWRRLRRAVRNAAAKWETLGFRIRLLRQLAMTKRACREEGYGWLLDE